MLIEQRLERCLAAADRVLAIADGAVVCDRDPSGFLEWAAEHQPALQTPGARAFASAGLRPLPSGVKQARTLLRREGLLAAPAPPSAPAADGTGRRQRRFARRPKREERAGKPVLSLRGVWHELRDGPAILRGSDLQLHAGEAVVLMGRNGAGKSTLLRHAGGLMTPTRGRVELHGELALLLQNPGDLFIHEHVGEEASAEALPRARPRRARSSATPATCPPVSASGWRWRWCWAASGPPPRSPSTSPPAGWTGRPRGASHSGSPRRPPRGYWCWSRPTTASSRSNLRPARCCWPADAWSRTGRSPRCSPAGATSRPKRPASSVATPTRSVSRRRPPPCSRARAAIAAPGAGVDVELAEAGT